MRNSRKEVQGPPLVREVKEKIAYDFHEAAGTLDLSDINMDGKLDVMDLMIFRSSEARERER